MRRSGGKAKWAFGSFALALALPVVAQQAPESLLPPGFGDAPETPAPAPARPAPAPTPGGVPAPALNPATPPDLALLPDEAANAAEEELTPEELAAQ